MGFWPCVIMWTGSFKNIYGNIMDLYFKTFLHFFSAFKWTYNSVEACFDWHDWCAERNLHAFISESNFNVFLYKVIALFILNEHRMHPDNEIECVSNRMHNITSIHFIGRSAHENTETNRASNVLTAPTEQTTHRTITPLLIFSRGRHDTGINKCLAA